MDTQRTAAAESGAQGGGRRRQLTAHLQDYKVSLPQSLMPCTAPLEDDSESASTQQLLSLSLQTESAATGYQLYTALRPPPCLSSPAAVDEVTQWDIASHATNLARQLNLGVGPQSPTPSEQSFQLAPIRIQLQHKRTGFSYATAIIKTQSGSRVKPLTSVEFPNRQQCPSAAAVIPPAGTAYPASR